MIVQNFYLEDWDWYVLVYYAVTTYYVDEILEVVKLINSSASELKKAEKVLKTGGYNVGLTYSSFEHRCSIVVIGLTTSADEFQNTFDHEKGHLAAHIKDACNLDAEGEEYQYLTGEVGQKMFKIAKRFLCDDCRSKYLLIANRLYYLDNAAIKCGIFCFYISLWLSLHQKIFLI